MGTSSLCPWLWQGCRGVASGQGWRSLCSGRGSSPCSQLSCHRFAEQPQWHLVACHSKMPCRGRTENNVFTVFCEKETSAFVPAGYIKIAFWYRDCQKRGRMPSADQAALTTICPGPGSHHRALPVVPSSWLSRVHLGQVTDG